MDMSTTPASEVSKMEKYGEDGSKSLSAEIDETSLDFGELDLTTDEFQVDLDTIEQDIGQFSEHKLVKDALSKEDLDLRAYARSFDGDLVEAEKASVDDYVAQSEKLIDLHQEIKVCVEILGTMEGMLSGFQSSLGSISEEIKYLQDESFSLNIRLKNRKELLGKVDDFVDQVFISEDFENRLTLEEVNFTYLEYLYELNRKAKFVNENTEKGVRAVDESSARMAKILGIVSNKLMTFLNQELQRLKEPHTNISVIQENLFIGKYIHFAKFLSSNLPKAWAEMISSYSDVMSKVYHGQFKEMFLQFAKLLTTTNPFSEKRHMIGMQEGKSRGFFSGRFSARSQQHFIPIRERVTLIKEYDAPEINLLVALNENGTNNSFESVFRSFHKTLFDATQAELSFIGRFFDPSAGKQSVEREGGVFYAEGLCSSIFSRTFKLCFSQVVERISKTYDGIEVLILITLVQVMAKAHAVEHGKGVMVFLPYLKKLKKKLYDRWNEVFEMNVKSVSPPQGSVSLHPHYITRRFAEYLVSISLIRASKKEVVAGIEKSKRHVETDAQEEEQFDNETLPAQMSRLMNVMHKFVDTLAQRHRNSMHHSILVINNVDLIYSVFQEHNVENEIAVYYKDLLQNEINTFMDQELEQHYSSILAFIREHTTTQAHEESSEATQRPGAGNDSASELEGQVEEGTLQIESTEENMANLEALVAEFDAGWKQGIEAINKDILQNFTNFKTGMYILKTTLTQLLLYYTQFLEAIKIVFKGRTPPFAKRIVSIQSIMYEIKKYSKMF